MKSNKFIATGVLLTAAALVLSGCQSGGRGAAPAETSTDAGTTETTEAPAAGGFEKGSVIGVALPDKTSENWVRAGAIFEEGLTEAGYKPSVQYASEGDAVASQQQQIEALITEGAKVIIVGAADGSQLGAPLEKAKAAGATVIAYDRLILNTDAVDYYVAFDNFKVGELQGQALLEGLEASGKPSPWNIELFSGSPDDNNAGVFFNGAMSVLQPKIDDGTLVVPSGQVDVAQTAIQDWTAENAQKRAETLLTGFYTDKDLNGVLSPNDNLARAIITAAEGAGKGIPVVTGQDSEEESLKWIIDGKQYQTINKSTPVLIDQVITMVDELQAGSEATVNDTEQYDNGVKVVPAYLIAPISVTQANIETAYADDPKLQEVIDGYKK